MAKRKLREIERLRTVVIYRDGKVGYYSRDRVEGGISPIYSTSANLTAARNVRTGPEGKHARWPEAY